MLGAFLSFVWGFLCGALLLAAGTCVYVYVYVHVTCVRVCVACMQAAI